MDLTEGAGEHQEGHLKDPSLPPHLTSLLTLSRDTGRTIDDRLAALLASIREWDWRAGATGHQPLAPVRPITATQPLAQAAQAAQVAPPARTTSRAPISSTPAGPRTLLPRREPDRPMPAPHRRALPSATPPPPPPPPLPPPPSPGRPIDAAPAGHTITPPPAPPPGPPPTPPEVTPSDRPGGKTAAVPNDAPTGIQAPPPRPVPTDPLPSIRLLPPEPESGVGLGAESEPKTVAVPIVPPGPDREGASAHDGAPATAVERPPEEEAPPAHRWPKNFGKVVLVLVTVLIVVVIVAIIRKSADNNPGGGSLTPTSVTHATTATPAVIPVSSSVKSAFSATSVDLTAANAAVTRALAGGAAQSPAQVAQEVAPYVTALDTFNYKNHFLVWPAALQVPAEDLTLRTDELIHYLSSISSASPATLTSWFAQFHSLARLNQTTDNALRKDIGLPASNSYPTT